VGALVSSLPAPDDRNPDGWELANLACVAKALLAAAIARTESRGAHTRLDFPLTDPEQRVRLVHRGTQTSLLATDPGPAT
jgi:succinate dehydrogenase/fumarate reductase flavoprotein subunit